MESDGRGGVSAAPPRVQQQAQVAQNSNPHYYAEEHSSHWTSKTLDAPVRKGLGGGRKAPGMMQSSVTRDSMNDLVFHGRYDEMRKMPVSKLQYEQSSAAFRAPFANAINTPPI